MKIRTLWADERGGAARVAMGGRSSYGAYGLLGDPYPLGFLGAAGSDTLGTNQGLQIGDSLVNPDGSVSLTMQPDGDLVLKANQDGRVLWHSGTANQGAVRAWMNWDGNFWVEDPRGKRLWSTNTQGHKDSRVRIEPGPNGNLIVWDGGNHQIWDAGATLAKPNPVAGGHGASHTDFGGIDHDLKNLSHDLEHFATDVVNDAKKFGPMILSEIQGILSLIPGIGTGISAAIGFAMALLEGGSPLEIAIRMAYGAIPIPPGIRNVTDPIVDGAIHFAKNPKDFTDAAITTLRDVVPSGIPREVFDTLVKIIVKKQPILKSIEGVATDVVKQVPGLQKVMDAMPVPGTVFESIKTIAPNLKIDPARIPQMLATVQAQVPHLALDANASAALVQHAQQRLVPMHAIAAASELAQLAHQLGGPAAAAAALAPSPPGTPNVPAALASMLPRPPGPQAPLPSPPPPPLPVAPPPPPPPTVTVAPYAPPPSVAPYPPPSTVAPAYPPHPSRRPYIPSRVTGHSAMETTVYPPYARHGYPPHPGGGHHYGVHGTVGGNPAPDCARWGEPIEMDGRMAGVARMLMNARHGKPTVAKGPDGVDYRFDQMEDGTVTARTCVG